MGERGGRGSGPQQADPWLVRIQLLAEQLQSTAEALLDEVRAGREDAERERRGDG